MTAVFDLSNRSPVAGLAEIDRQILRLVADGLTSKEIARALDRSPYTIDSRLKDVCQRLGADTRAQAAAMLLREEAASAPPELGGPPPGGIEPSSWISPVAGEDGDPPIGLALTYRSLSAFLADPRLAQVAKGLTVILLTVVVAAYLLANTIEAIQGVFLTVLRG